MQRFLRAPLWACAGGVQLTKNPDSSGRQKKEELNEELYCSIEVSIEDRDDDGKGPADSAQSLQIGDRGSLLFRNPAQLTPRTLRF